MFSITTNTPEETFSLAKRFGKHIEASTLVLFYGDLGAGKTLFAQGIGHTLGIKRMKSPSFILASEYEDTTPPLLHIDLYRISTAREIDSLEIDDYIHEGFAVCVEWSENWKEVPNEHIKIEIKKIRQIGKKGDPKRQIIFSAFGEKHEQILSEVKEELANDYTIN